MSKQKKKPTKLDLAFYRVTREEARTEQHSQCFYCYEPITFKTATADHVVPRKAGGTNAKQNIVACCEPCNAAKGSMSKAAFVKLIKSFPKGLSYAIILTWSRRRINLALNRLEKNVTEACR